MVVAAVPSAHRSHEPDVTTLVVFALGKSRLVIPAATPRRVAGHWGALWWHGDFAEGGAPAPRPEVL